MAATSRHAHLEHIVQYRVWQHGHCPAQQQEAAIWAQPAISALHANSSWPPGERAPRHSHIKRACSSSCSRYQQSAWQAVHLGANAFDDAHRIVDMG